MSEAHGVIVLHKPAGMTSHDCVARVRRLFQTKKVGHTGTLDPDVTGVLPICIGNATRIVEYLQELPKTYEVIMRIGSSTTTEDASGEVLEEVSVDPTLITAERVERAFGKFIGDIEQVPPMYSAVKVNGKRLYDLAREGVVIERKARVVTIYELILHEIDKGGNIDVSFTCTCSKGTYVRTLCVDLGKELGYPAHMAKLIRTKSGPFTIEQAIPLEQLEGTVSRGEALSGLLISIEDALSFIPRYDINPERESAVLNGLQTALPGVQTEEGSLLRLFSRGKFLGLHRVYFGARGPFGKPEKVFRA